MDDVSTSKQQVPRLAPARPENGSGKKSGRSLGMTVSGFVALLLVRWRTRSDFRTRVAVSLRLDLFRKLLDFAEDPHQVAAENLVEVGGRVAALVQRLRNLWQICRRIQPLRRAVNAVEVRAEPDVVNACDLDHVINVVNQISERRTRQLGGERREGRVHFLPHLRS